MKSMGKSPHSVHDTLLVSPGHPHGNSRTLMFPKPQKAGSLLLAEPWKNVNR